MLCDRKIQLYTMLFKRIFLALILFIILIGCSTQEKKIKLNNTQTHNTQAIKKIPVKMVIVSMFENGEVTGDRPGEFQLWVEGRKLNTVFDFPMGEYALRMDDKGVLGICVGGGIPNATASIMALGMDPRFDLSKAYWLIAGIAGGDPADLSLGSAAWATHVVDGDLVYEIDSREIPEDWPYGLIPLGGKKPADTPEDIYTGWTLDTIHFNLNEKLAKWAYENTKNLTLEEGIEAAKFKENFYDYPNALRKPFVTMGETLSASTYWHGIHFNNWANDWIQLYAGKNTNFMTSNMEDSGTLTALTRLSRTQRIDLSRIMILRTVSNFTLAPTNQSSTWSATAPYPDKGLSAFKSAYKVGNTIVDTIIGNWDNFKDSVPESH